MNDLLKLTGPFAPYAATVVLAITGVKVVLSWRAKDVKQIEQEVVDKLTPQLKLLESENADLRSQSADLRNQSAELKGRLDELEDKIMAASRMLVKLVANCPDDATKNGMVEVMELIGK